MIDRAPEEILALVEAALARHGAAGKLQTDGETLSLVGNGPTVSEPIAPLVAGWAELPFAERQRRCTLVARALTRKRHPEPKPRASHSSFPLGAVVAAGVLLGGAGFYFNVLRDDGSTSAAAASAAAAGREPADPEQQRRQRASRVCNATRTRLARGATVTPADAEGWVVELTLLRRFESGEWPPPDPFVKPAADTEQALLAWEGLPAPAPHDPESTRASLVTELWPENMPQYRARVLTLFGEYVMPFFRERERITLVRFAHALAEQQGAELGALYGRCEDGKAHHMGAWFLGHSVGAAATALLFFMGAHADAPHLPREMLSSNQQIPVEPAFAISTLLDVSKRLRKPDLASLIGAQDGMVAGPPHFITVSFPFVETDRAVRASASVASRIGGPPFASATPAAKR